MFPLPAMAMARIPCGVANSIDFSCFYEGSPMIVRKISFSERDQCTVRFLLGSFVIYDVLPWLGGKVQKLPCVAFEALLPLATTGKIWNAMVLAVNLNWQVKFDERHFLPIFSSPRLLTISFTNPVAHIMPFKGPLDWADTSEPLFFSMPCPFDCQSYSVPLGHAKKRCGSSCCTGNIHVHPSPLQFHVALEKLHLSQLSGPTLPIPSAPAPGCLIETSVRLGVPPPRPFFPVWNNTPPPPRWPFLPQWKGESSSSCLHLPPPPRPPPSSTVSMTAYSTQIQSFSQPSSSSPSSSMSKRRCVLSSKWPPSPRP